MIIQWNKSTKFCNVAKERKKKNKNFVKKTKSGLTCMSKYKCYGNVTFCKWQQKSFHKSKCPCKTSESHAPLHTHPTVKTGLDQAEHEEVIYITDLETLITSCFMKHSHPELGPPFVKLLHPLMKNSDWTCNQHWTQATSPIVLAHKPSNNRFCWWC